MAYHGQKRNDLTADFVRDRLAYDQDTGILTWRVKPRKNLPAGIEAGKRARGHIMVGIGGNQYCAHRLAFLIVAGRWPEEIDHINRDPYDNRWENLRECTRSQNNMNRTRDMKGAYRGVNLCPHSTTRWRARIKVAGKQLYLGSFGTAEEAFAARHAAERVLFGVFSPLSH